jgi:hypothetical protein
MLVLPISVYLDELLQDGSLTAIATLGEFGRVVIMTVHTALVLVVAVRSPKNGWAHGTREMLNVILSVQSGNVRPAKSLAALVAEQIESSEVVCFAQWVLPGGLLRHGEEFGGDNLATVLCAVSTGLDT